MRREITPAVRHRIFAGATRFVGVVGPRQICVIASDATPDRMGDVLEPSGVDLTNFRRNPIVLAQHDASKPIARAPDTNYNPNTRAVESLIEFPPEGVSELSDQYLRLMKAGVVSAVSVGFRPIKWEPLDGAGYRFTRWELMELSCVSVPANPSALVTAKSVRREAQEEGDWKPIGNCGRPLSKTCGMKIVAECAIHGMGQVGTGSGPGDDAAAKIAAWRAKLALPVTMTAPWMAPASDAAATAAGRRKHLAEVRARHSLVEKPRLDVLVALAQFRCLRM